MKTLVSVTEIQGEGLVGLLGQRVTLFCLNYIYTGKLEGVDDTACKLVDAALVYETGGFDEPVWKDAQKLPRPIYVQRSAIEMFTVLK